MKKKQQIYCPYKEYWFGSGEEAQEKPAGFKFKRGTLLKLKSKRWMNDESYFTHYHTHYDGNQPNGRAVTFPEGFTEKTIALLVDYDSEISRTKFWDPCFWKSTWTSTTKHTFTFLYGEKWQSVVLHVWGQENERNRHNEMWHKARKPRKLPKKKRKRLGRGFAFED